MISVHLFRHRKEQLRLKRILLTGMSGIGKSTIISELATRGYKAVDLDSDMYSEWTTIVGEPAAGGSPVEPDRDWMWQEDRVQELLSNEDSDLLFVSGCAQNMGKFFPQFDEIVLLSAPNDVIVKRLATRTSNAYGKHPDEVARVLELVETVEPLLRKAAGHEIDTNGPLKQVTEVLLQIVQRSHF